MPHVVISTNVLHQLNQYHTTCILFFLCAGDWTPYLPGNHARDTSLTTVNPSTGAPPTNPSHPTLTGPSQRAGLLAANPATNPHREYLLSLTSSGAGRRFIQFMSVLWWMRCTQWRLALRAILEYHRLDFSKTLLNPHTLHIQLLDIKLL